MTKRDAVRSAAEKVGVSKLVMEEHINAFLEYVAEVLVDGEEVCLFPLGKLQVKELRNTKRRRLWLEASRKFKKLLKRSPIEVPEWYRELGVVVEEE